MLGSVACYPKVRETTSTSEYWERSNIIDSMHHDGWLYCLVKLHKKDNGQDYSIPKKPTWSQS